MSRPEIYGLTIAQPWPWAFSLGKRVENRSWAPPRSMLGQKIALHGGRRKSPRTYDFQKGAEAVVRIGKPAPVRYMDVPQVEGVFAVARLARVVRVDSELPDGDCRWFFGPFGWVLEDYVRLPEPVPCKGALGLWALPDDVLERVRAGYLADAWWDA